MQVKFDDETTAEVEAKNKVIETFRKELRERNNLSRALADFREERSVNAGLAAQNRQMEEQIARLRAKLGEPPHKADCAAA